MNLVSILILALIAVGFFAAVKYSRKKGCSCGQHSCRGCTLKCRMPSSRSALEESAAAAYSADTSTESRTRTQPKSQTEKQFSQAESPLKSSRQQGQSIRSCLHHQDHTDIPADAGYNQERPTTTMQSGVLSCSKPEVQSLREKCFIFWEPLKTGLKRENG